jgi:hypothetical protein
VVVVVVAVVIVVAVVVVVVIVFVALETPGLPSPRQSCLFCFCCCFVVCWDKVCRRRASVFFVVRLDNHVLLWLLLFWLMLLCFIFFF